MTCDGRKQMKLQMHILGREQTKQFSEKQKISIWQKQVSLNTKFVDLILDSLKSKIILKKTEEFQKKIKTSHLELSHFVNAPCIFPFKILTEIYG